MVGEESLNENILSLEGTGYKIQWPDILEDDNADEVFCEGSLIYYFHLDCAKCNMNLQLRSKHTPQKSHTHKFGKPFSTPFLALSWDLLTFEKTDT